jgi:hypothetical protein
MTLTDRIVIWRADIVLRRESRRAERELRRAFAAYDTPAQRDDLLAAIDRYPDDVAQRYRDILTSQSMAQLHRHGGSSARWPAMQYR